MNRDEAKIILAFAQNVTCMLPKVRPANIQLSRHYSRYKHSRNLKFFMWEFIMLRMLPYWAHGWLHEQYGLLWCVTLPDDGKSDTPTMLPVWNQHMQCSHVHWNYGCFLVSAVPLKHAPCSPNTMDINLLSWYKIHCQKSTLLYILLISEGKTVSIFSNRLS
jgi:hypothetical protein